MNLNLVNEAIALVVGLITTFLIPYLNQRFGMHLNPTQVGNVATEVLDDAVKKSPPPPAQLDLPPVPLNEIGK